MLPATKMIPIGASNKPPLVVANGNANNPGPRHN